MQQLSKGCSGGRHISLQRMHAGPGAHPACYEARAELHGRSMALRACLYEYREQEAAAEQQDGAAPVLRQLSSMTAAMDIYPGGHSVTNARLLLCALACVSCTIPQAPFCPA